MKRESKSARNRKLGIFFLLSVTVAACADTKFPSWMTGEPDESVLSAPRVVVAPKNPGDKAWPNLAEVPNQKPKFSSVADRESKINALNSENAKALAEMERIRNIELDDTRTRERMSDDEETFSFSALKP